MEPARAGPGSIQIEGNFLKPGPGSHWSFCQKFDWASTTQKIGPKIGISQFNSKYFSKFRMESVQPQLFFAQFVLGRFNPIVFRLICGFSRLKSEHFFKIRFEPAQSFACHNHDWAGSIQIMFHKKRKTKWKKAKKREKTILEYIHTLYGLWLMASDARRLRARGLKPLCLPRARLAPVWDSFLGPTWLIGVHHPLSPVIKLGIRHPRKKERCDVYERGR